VIKRTFTEALIYRAYTRSALRFWDEKTVLFELSIERLRLLIIEVSEDGISKAKSVGKLKYQN